MYVKHTYTHTKEFKTLNHLKWTDKRYAILLHAMNHNFFHLKRPKKCH